jgi:hypothetical protein
MLSSPLGCQAAKLSHERSLSGLLVGMRCYARGTKLLWVKAKPDTRMGIKSARIHVRVGGHGPAVVLLHGHGETGDMWEPLAAKLVVDHTVAVPDLRGMGLSVSAVVDFLR